MHFLVSGACGFVGSTIAVALAERGQTVTGFDNFVRPGSEINRSRLSAAGIGLRHADLRMQSDVEALPDCDIFIDAAANPSVLAGVDGRTSSRQVIEHNLLGTINALEYCKARRAGFILLSTSRVYSIAALAALPVAPQNNAFRLTAAETLPAGISPAGLTEAFSTQAPVSLYGATKLASEQLALEYGETFKFPVFINRCGVLAGAGQFGRADQGIFSFWIHSWCQRRPLRYLGFGGHGFQVRDCLHPRDLVPLLLQQAAAPEVAATDRILNISGGLDSALSLRQLSDWCRTRFGDHEVIPDGTERPFDLPWVVLDNSRARRAWGWAPQTALPDILEEIAQHAEHNPTWLDLSNSA